MRIVLSYGAAKPLEQTLEEKSDGADRWWQLRSPVAVELPPNAPAPKLEVDGIPAQSMLRRSILRSNAKTLELWHPLQSHPACTVAAEAGDSVVMTSPDGLATAPCVKADMDLNDNNEATAGITAFKFFRRSPARLVFIAEARFFFGPAPAPEHHAGSPPQKLPQQHHQQPVGVAASTSPGRPQIKTEEAASNPTTATAVAPLQGAAANDDEERKGKALQEGLEAVVEMLQKLERSSTASFLAVHRRLQNLEDRLVAVEVQMDESNTR